MTASESHATPSVPARFLPRGGTTVRSIGLEIFFAPLTYFQRVRAVAFDPGAPKLALLLTSALVLLGSQLFYLAIAATFLSLVSGEALEQILRSGLPAFFLGGGGAFLVSIAWHTLNNWRDLPRNRSQHLFIASTRALIRSIMIANAFFFVGVGLAIFRPGITGGFIQPPLLAFSFVGLAAGAVARLTLAVIHFEPLVQADRMERFYLDTLVRRRSFCAAVFLFGAIALACGVAFLSPSSEWSSIGDAESWSADFNLLILSYAGMSMLLGGMITAWGFVFPVSFARHIFLLVRCLKGKLEPIEALSRHPAVYDELFLLPTPGLPRLLGQIPPRYSEDEATRWLIFLLAQSYKRRAASAALAKAINDGYIRAGTVLGVLRERPAWLDVPSFLSEFLDYSDTRFLFKYLAGELSLNDIGALMNELEGLDYPRSASGLCWTLRSIRTLVEANSIEDWRWREPPAEAVSDPLGIIDTLMELNGAKRLILSLSPHASYSERSLVFHQAITILREAQATFRADPWLGGLCRPVIERWSRHLHALMSRALSSAELDIYVAPTPLLVDRPQEIQVVFTNLGPGRVRDMRVQVTLQGTATQVGSSPDELAVKGRRTLTLELRPSRTGLLEGEVEVTFVDDLRETRRQIHPVEFVSKGALRGFREFPNPFIPGSPVSTGRAFRGRRDIMTAFAKNTEVSLIVSGPRRIGKTSVLLQLRNIARSEGRSWVFLDLQPLAAEPDAARLTRRLSEALLPGSAVDSVPEAVTTFVEAGERPVLFLDEGDHLPRIEALLRGQFTSELRSHLNSEHPFQLVIAVPFGSLVTSDPACNQLLGMLRALRLPLLSGQDIIELFVSPLEGIVDVMPRATEEFVRLTGGHPHIAQLLAHAVVASAIERRQVLIDAELLRETAEELLLDLDAFFRIYQWQDLHTHEKEFLADLARGRVPRKGRARTVESLREKCLIVGAGNIQIPMGLYRKWLLKETFE